MNKCILAVLFIASAMGCVRSEKKVVSDIEASQKANAENEQLEWESSDYHPTQLFIKWRKDKDLGAEVCKALLAKEVTTLTLFEEELKKPENQQVLKDCKIELQSKLEAYWKAEREKVQAP